MSDPMMMMMMIFNLMAEHRIYKPCSFYPTNVRIKQLLPSVCDNISPFGNFLRSVEWRENSIFVPKNVVIMKIKFPPPAELLRVSGGTQPETQETPAPTVGCHQRSVYGVSGAARGGAVVP